MIKANEGFKTNLLSDLENQNNGSLTVYLMEGEAPSLEQWLSATKKNNTKENFWSGENGFEKQGLATIEYTSEQSKPIDSVFGELRRDLWAHRKDAIIQTLKPGTISWFILHMVVNANNPHNNNHALFIGRAGEEGGDAELIVSSKKIGTSGKIYLRDFKANLVI